MSLSCLSSSSKGQRRIFRRILRTCSVITSACSSDVAAEYPTASQVLASSLGSPDPILTGFPHPLFRNTSVGTRPIWLESAFIGRSFYEKPPKCLLASCRVVEAPYVSCIESVRVCLALQQQAQDGGVASNFSRLLPIPFTFNRAAQAFVVLSGGFRLTGPTTGPHASNQSSHTEC